MISKGIATYFACLVVVLTLLLFSVGCTEAGQSLNVTPQAEEKGSLPSTPNAAAVPSQQGDEGNSLIVQETSVPPSQIFTPTLLPTATPTPITVPSPAPTLSIAESEEYILDLLETNGNCELPCFWGIAPGETSLEEAQKFVQHLGWKGDWYFQGTVFETGIDLDRLLIRLSIVDQDKQVSKIHVGLAGDGYADLVEAYSLHRLLLSYGIPTQIWINLATGLEISTPDKTAFNILIYYQDEGILAKYGGASIRIGSHYRICPNQLHYGDPAESETRGALSMTLGSKAESPQELIEPFGLFDGMLTVEEAFGLTPEVFHQRVLDEAIKVPCFETPRNIWQ